mgnify:CR=1 FL=1
MKLAELEPIQLLTLQVIWISMREERSTWIIQRNFQIISRFKLSNKYYKEAILVITPIKLYLTGKMEVVKVSFNIIKH